MLKFYKLLTFKGVFLFCILLCFVFYGGLEVTAYRLDSDKLNDKERIRVILLADLHSHIYEPRQMPLIQKIKDAKPDVILLSGDILDDEASDEGVHLLLSGIQDFAPIFYVTGNHEWWSGVVDEKIEIMKEYGVVVLRGDTHDIAIKGHSLVVSGIDDLAARDYKASQGTMENQLSKLQDMKDSERFSILLAHRPEVIGEYLHKNYDLIVSGHAHGGQVRIPFLLKGLYAPNQGFFPELTSGVVRHGNTSHVISRGLSYNYRLPRIFNPPEIVVIELQ